MGLSDKLLTPFQKWFCPPVLNTPFSTIKLPPSYVSIPLVFFSFGIICSGFVFCYVRGMPMTGAVRGRDGRPVHSWIDLNGGLSGQFLAEGLIASILFTVSALSIISAIYVIGVKEELTETQKVLQFFGFSSPFWCFFSFCIFKMKFPNFSPSFSKDR